MVRADGTCVSSAAAEPATNAPAHLGGTRAGPGTTNRKPTMTRGTGGSVAEPLLVCLLIFVSFCILMLVITYSFRIRSRRLAVRTTYREVRASDLSNGSVASLMDNHNTMVPPPPPSYEQATLRVAELYTSPSAAPHTSSSRYWSRTASTVTVPSTSSPDMSSSLSYGSLLTRSFLLTPSDSAPSLTDLTTATGRHGHDAPQHERY
nr:uncharacterized protein LOC123758116 [Procambarus clarkii]